MKTTNYYNSFIEVADDCPAKAGEVPPEKGDEKTTARIQFEMVHEHPYQFTSDDVIFQVFVKKNMIHAKMMETAKENFFSKNQPCFRSSPLTKRYGWGVHSDKKGRIAIYPVESEEYNRLRDDRSLKHFKALRTTGLRKI